MKHLLIKALAILIVISNVYANDNNVIVVGTTGDYPPLTYHTKNGYMGKDIDIFTAFAKANNFKLKFVVTTWSDLRQDLINGKFEVAIGGISDSKERAENFFLSNAIESSSKVPLIRCSDSKRFSDFAAIDNNNVLVVENRGGTNQSFALEHIKHATIILYPQNATTLASLTQASFRTDVMFTDDIEANYRHEINPLLCVANIPQKFPQSNKVFLFSKTGSGRKLSKLFNRWWQLNKNYY
jgi:cyclohexadienyl dehydratase